MLSLFFWFYHILYAFVLTYLVIGFVVSFEVTVAMSGGNFALKWIRKHFTYKEFYWSVIIFYPLLRLAYFFLEYIPSFFTHEIRCVFNLESLFDDLFNHK